MCIPRYYGTERFGKPTDRRPDPARANIRFNGKLRDETRQNEALALFSGTESGGVLSLPCGYGKTTVALAICGKVGSTNNDCCPQRVFGESSGGSVSSTFALVRQSVLFKETGSSSNAILSLQ